jgi:2-polyprenyl-3-methyl-5-hydroxy-6-metoxy-1,4-benzoquinol methylase
MESAMDFETYAVRKSMSRPIVSFRAELIDGHVRSGTRVLDVGSGDGVCLQYLATITPPECVMGTEISQIRADRVRARGFACVKVDSCTLPFPDASFEVVTFFEVIEHLAQEDARLMLREIARVLVDGGILIGSTPNYPVKRAYDWSNALHVLAGRARRLRPGAGGAAAQRSESEPAAAPLAELGAFDKLAALFSDDPTHVYRLSFASLAQLTRESGYETALFQTFGTRPAPTQVGRFGNLLSNKVAFVCRRSPRTQARSAS